MKGNSPMKNSRVPCHVSSAWWLGFVFVAGVTSGTARARSPVLKEDDARRSIVLSDERVSFELAANLGIFKVDTEFSPDSGASVTSSGENLQVLQIAMRLHALRAMGVSLGVFHAQSASGGVDIIPFSGGEPARGQAGASFSQTGLLIGLEANPIGYGAVQMSAGLDLLLGGGFSLMYHAGMRINLGRWTVWPRVSYADFSQSVEDELYDLGSNELWGLGGSVQLAYAFGQVTP